MVEMLRREYRIVLPITVEEYRLAQLWSVAERSKLETGAGEGIEWVNNEPYEKKDGETGQYTHKIYHVSSRAPRIIRMLAPKGSLEMHEKSWNAYPNIKTIITNPDYMKENFEICIQSKHFPDLGDSENVHNLPENEWKNTEVIRIDIVNDPIQSSDYKKEFDPSLFQSKKTGRGPLGADWIEKLRAEKPPGNYMCAYKLVSCRVNWFGLQSTLESRIQKFEHRLFTTFHRQVVCWMDNWYGVMMDEIRQLEDKAKEELDVMRMTGEVKGMAVQ